MAKKEKSNGHKTETPDVSHIRNVEVTHETSDVNVRGVLTFAVRARFEHDCGRRRDLDVVHVFQCATSQSARTRADGVAAGRALAS